MPSRVKLKEKEKKLENKRRKKLKKEKRIEKFKKSRRTILTVLLFIILLFLIYSILIEPKIININEINIKTNEISENFHGIKILHFSDLHYGTSINKNNLNKIINKINATKPDIVIFTGDLIDKSYKASKSDIKFLTKSLKKIDSNLGKYGIIGEDDFYNKDFNNIMYDSDFIVLKNNYDTVYNKDNNPILIYGLDNITYGDPNIEKINEVNNISFKILLMHETDYINKIDLNDIDLILSGHTLGGIIKVFNKPLFLKDNSKIYYESHYKIDSADMFISNGLGTNKIPIRFMNTPSMNLYRLIKKES